MKVPLLVEGSSFWAKATGLMSGWLFIMLLGLEGNTDSWVGELCFPTDINILVVAGVMGEGNLSVM